MSSTPDLGDFVVVVWANPAALSGSSQARPFETIVGEDSNVPIAWSLPYLRSSYSNLLEGAYLVLSEEDLRSWMSFPLFATCSRKAPLLVPVPLVGSVLAWHDFEFVGV